MGLVSSLPTALTLVGPELGEADPTRAVSCTISYPDLISSREILKPWVPGQG